jgi:hypothetical protein
MRRNQKKGFALCDAKEKPAPRGKARAVVHGVLTERENRRLVQQNYCCKFRGFWSPDPTSLSCSRTLRKAQLRRAVPQILTIEVCRLERSGPQTRALFCI